MKFFYYVPLFLIAACTSQNVIQEKETATAAAEPITLFYQSNRLGTFEPCGCHSTPYGGMDREKNVIDAEKKQHSVIYVDGGNTLAPEELKFKKSYYQTRAKLVLEMLEKASLEVMGVGPEDLKLGADFLKELASSTKVGFISTNLVDSKGNLVFEPYRVITKNGVRLGFLNLTPEGKYENLVAKSFDSTFPKVISKLKTEADVLVLLTQLSSKEVDKLVEKNSDFALIIGGDRKISLETPSLVHAGKTLILEASNFGFTLGKFTWNIQLPFKGNFSSEEIQKNKEQLSAVEAGIKNNPESVYLKKEQELLNASQLEPIENGSTYSNQLIKLKEEDFGTPNELTKLMVTAKEKLKLSLIEKKNPKKAE